MAEISSFQSKPQTLQQTITNAINTTTYFYSIYTISDSSFTIVYPTNFIISLSIQENKIYKLRTISNK